MAVQTRLRLSELTSLKHEDLHVGVGAHVRVIGKGRKERCAPLSKNTRAVLATWAREPPLTEDQPLFPNARGGILSSHGMHYSLNQHIRTASVKCSPLMSKRVSPHVLRHTTAMDLMQEDAEQSTIAMWFGHESIETTQIYLDADLAMKQAVLDKTKPPEGKPGRYRPMIRYSRSSRACNAATATSNMPSGSPSRPSTALFAVVCGRCCAGRSTDRARDDVYAITNNGQIFFANLGLFTMSEAHRLARQSRCGNN